MQNTDLIIEKFRKGSPEQRLYLYLEFRDLRSAFEQIEKLEYAESPQVKSFAQEKITFVPSCRRLISWCYTLIS